MAKKAERDGATLVCRFSAIGDIALTVPVLYDACESNPDMRFVMLTRKMAVSIFVNPPANLTVVGVNLDDYKGPAGMVRLAAEMRREYDVKIFLDLHDVLRSKLLRLFMRLAGVSVYTIDKGRREKKALTRARHKELRPLKTTTERYADVFRRAGLALRGGFVSVFSGRDADPSVFAAVSAPKKEGERWIAIAPFAKHAGKIYPPEMMEEVVAKLSGEADTRLFIFGAGKEETEVIESMAAKYPGVVNMAKARLGFGAELALQSFCDAMISMDSANMHLASIAGTRVISVWGATHPYCGFTGWRQDPSDSVQLDLDCRPCSVFGNKPCRRGDYRCLRGIEPSAILRRVVN